ncbi:hypothetical protein BD779DRAFT_1523933 [Infundibulicybe gibba]|nr:hypothetical protein BD779DRAFT_1523933 [Infundibulicybe gibba]
MARSSSPTLQAPSAINDQHRQSLFSNNTVQSSSASSFKTAPLSALSQSPTSPRESSNHTLGAPRDSENVNPIHTLSNGAQEVHIIKVTRDKVQLESGPMKDSLLQKVGKTLAGPMSNHEAASRFGPLPPSPPASVDRDTLEDDAGYDNDPIPEQQLLPPPPLLSSHSEPGPKPILFDEPESIRERQTSTASSSRRAATTTQDSQYRSSTDTKTSLRTATATDLTTMHSKSNAHLSADGYLQPPPLTVHRPARRNTTGSSPRHPTNAFLEDGDAPTGELASDIQIHAEQIRRERMSKRAKEAEAALTRQDTRGTGVADGAARDDVVLVGNLIGEDHVNYVLMYNMLTGIRIGVSRCQAKIKRPLTDDDFTSRHKFSFDIIGNELTPSAKYDFKFKDYAPWVFRALREEHFHLDPADYLLSLTSKYILSSLAHQETIRHSEHKFLLKILKDYHAHVKEHPHTLLSRFYGLHRIHFVIMNNLFPSHRDIHETFDLKGSTVGRLYPEEKAAQNPRAVLKDLNWINREKMLELGPEKRALLTEQLRRDAEFLKKINVMDYSLLVGIHNMQRGNRDNVRKNTLKVFSPDIPTPPHRKPTQKVGSKSPEASMVRRAMRSSDPKRLGKDTIRLPEEDTGDRQHFIFYRDEGGLRATDEANDGLDTIYYLGVIDILTPYSGVKKLEHFWKGLRADRHKISPVPPEEYSDRFFAFMKAIMRGGEGGARFKAE